MKEFKHLSRLELPHYCGQAYVHWTYTIQDRRTGWLKPIFYYKFRELLTHALFRYSLVCPIYCLMPDHIHMVWIGFSDQSNQVNATRFLRKQVGIVLGKLGHKFQHQAYDRVLKEDQRQESNFNDLVEYIARNPERAKLIPADQFRSYPYSDCLLPGYPELKLWQNDFWPRFWRIYSFLRQQEKAT